MGRQRLGRRKQQLCETITGRKYRVCLTTLDHFVAMCLVEGRPASIIDDINYKTGRATLDIDVNAGLKKIWAENPTVYGIEGS